MIYREVVNVKRLHLSVAIEGNDASTETHSAVVYPDSLSSDEMLWNAYQWRDEVVLRCASMEVRGMVTSARYEGTEKVYELAVHHVEQQKTGAQQPFV